MAGETMPISINDNFGSVGPPKAGRLFDSSPFPAVEVNFSHRFRPGA
ncbi:MAG: hypothetical protein WBW84_00170 [Acidobacteriaceae bacterium]